MTDQRVEAKKTAPQMRDYATAALVASEPVLGAFLTKEQVGVLWAQYFTETSAQNCFNWNIGNVKKFDGDGYDYHCLVGTWECYPDAQAQALIASGQAVESHSPGQIATAGPGRLPIIFQPPHPQTRFRAYPSLGQAMGHHLQLLQRRFAKAWPAIMAGDPMSTALALHDQRYYTASVAQYGGNMVAAYQRWMRANDFDLAEAVVLAVSDPGVTAAAMDVTVLSPDELALHDDSGNPPDLNAGYVVG